MQYPEAGLRSCARFEVGAGALKNKFAVQSDEIGPRQSRTTLIKRARISPFLLSRLDRG
jgi:hypothetical protein